MRYQMSATIASLRLRADDRITLARKIHDGLPASNVRGFLRTSGFTQEQLFRAAHIPVSTGRRRLAASRFGDHESERIARIARIYDQAASLLPGPARARQWLMQENPRLGGQPPIQVAGTELGALEVEALLGRLAHGVH